MPHAGDLHSNGRDLREHAESVCQRRDPNCIESWNNLTVYEQMNNGIETRTDSYSKYART